MLRTLPEEIKAQVVFKPGRQLTSLFNTQGKLHSSFKFIHGLKSFSERSKVSFRVRNNFSIIFDETFNEIVKDAQ